MSRRTTERTATEDGLTCPHCDALAAWDSCFCGECGTRLGLAVRNFCGRWGKVIAALYVQSGGAYYGLPDVDPWDETRDARLYDGPWPVVAHPPCSRWCQLASVNEARWGARIGDDGGCFAAALKAVRRWGGVLEHPAYSLAWEHFGLPIPGRYGWTGSLTDEGVTTEVTQAAYGHPARKRTWLYFVGENPPALEWDDPEGVGVVGAGIHSGQSAGRPRIAGLAASATPIAFRDALLSMARGEAREDARAANKAARA